MRILFVVKNLRLSNGVSSYVMNYYRELKKEKWNIDFLLISDVETPYYDEIKNNNDQIFILPSYKKNIFKLVKYICNLYDSTKYDIIHSNVVNSGSIILFLAKLKGIKVRILHSHATQVGDGVLKKIRNIPFKKMAVSNANTYFACSKLAGEDLFKKRKFYVINNAINIEKFKYNEQNALKIKKKLGIVDKKIILVVGRITKQKNPFFIVDIMKELIKKDKNYILLWLGNGNLDDKIKDYISQNKLEEYIKLFGAVSNVEDYYSVADCFILPSIYEGLPVVGIEAQISGLYCLFSDKITREVALGEKNCEFLEISTPKIWYDKICSLNYNRHENIMNIDYSDYTIEKQSKKLFLLYNELIEKKGKQNEK